MNIEFLIDWKHKGVQYKAGDPSACKEEGTPITPMEAEVLIKAGAAKDLSGEMNTGELKPGARSVEEVLANG